MPRKSSVTAHQTALLLRLNEYLFPPLIFTAFGMFSLDAVAYPGFLEKNLGVSPVVFMIFGAISYVTLLLQKLLFKDELNEETKLVIRANFVIFPFALLIYLLFSQLERANYANYVFSTFHIHLASLEQLVFFSFLLTLFYVVSYLSKMRFPDLLRIKVPGKPHYSYDGDKLKMLAFYGSLGLLISIQLVAIAAFSLNDMVDIVRHPLASFQERQIEKFGGPYKTFEFIKRHTEPHSVIAVPPQFVWGIVGNIGFSRYFLYPRFLIHPEDFTPETMPAIDYYIIAEPIPEYGKDTHKVWPIEAMAGDAIYLFNERLNEEVTATSSAYTPHDSQYQGRWGIIKVKTTKTVNGERE